MPNLLNPYRAIKKKKKKKKKALTLQFIFMRESLSRSTEQWVHSEMLTGGHRRRCAEVS